MPTRRALVSATDAAATGMHSASSTLALSGATATIAFWKKNPNAGGNNTMFSSSSGQYHVINFNGSLIYQVVARGNGVNTAATTGCAADRWDHVTVQWGLNIDGTADLVVWINGVKDQTLDTVLSNELFTAGYHFLMGDDNPSGVTDDGWQGRLFDVVLLEGIHSPTDLNYDSISGNWKDLSGASLPSVFYRIDGQNPSAPGEDSSGNARNFVVENSGVTTDAGDVPPGANGLTTWNPQDKSFEWSLSNGNLTAHQDKGYDSSAKVRATVLGYLASDPNFHEVVFTIDLLVAGTFQLAIGNKVRALTDNMGWSGNELTVLENGQLSRTSNNLGNIGALAQGDKVRAIMKSDRAWFRRERGATIGDWNGSVSADPQTNTGGIDISAITGNLIPQVYTSVKGQKVTADFSNWDVYATPPATDIEPPTGVYALSGQTVSVTRQLLSSVATGSYALSGQAPTLTRQYRVDADAGSLALTGFAPDLQTALKIDAAAGVYTVTGEVPVISRSLLLSQVAPGSYALAGAAPSIASSLLVEADLGSYVVTGHAPGLNRSLLVPAATGDYTLTGGAPSLQTGTRLDADPGSYNLTGLAPVLLKAYRIGAVTGSYSVSGFAPEISAGVVLEPDAGAYALSGQAPTLLRSLSVQAPAGVYVQTGQEPVLSSGEVMNPDTGGYSITGNAPLLLAGRRIVAEPGVYSLAGAAPEILRALRLDPGAGVYVVTGLAPDLSGADTRDPHVLIVSVAEDNLVQLVGIASGPFVIISQED